MTDLEELKPWIRKVARGFTKDPGLQDDLTQEGWIAAWKALEKSEQGNSKSFAKKAALWRMTSVYTKGDYLTDYRRSYGGATSLVPMPYADEADPDQLYPIWQKLQILEGFLELAYHYGEINEALDSLSPGQREYVHLRFWKGYNSPELTQHFGYEPWGLWRAAKAKLVERLGHLRDDTIPNHSS